jgi:hypothetical protein
VPSLKDANNILEFFKNNLSCYIKDLFVMHSFKENISIRNEKGKLVRRIKRDTYNILKRLPHESYIIDNETVHMYFTEEILNVDKIKRLRKARQINFGSKGVKYGQ